MENETLICALTKALIELGEDAKLEEIYDTCGYRLEQVKDIIIKYDKYPTIHHGYIKYFYEDGNFYRQKIGSCVCIRIDEEEYMRQRTPRKEGNK